jgi:hypothetical protein
MTDKELRRLEIDELLGHAQRGHDERIEAALELLRRRESKHLRKRSRTALRSRGAVTARTAKPQTAPNT